MAGLDYTIVVDVDDDGRVSFRVLRVLDGGVLSGAPVAERAELEAVPAAGVDEGHDGDDPKASQ